MIYVLPKIGAEGMKIEGYSMLTVEDSEHEPIHDDNSGKGIAAVCRNSPEIDSRHLSPSATQRGSNRIKTKMEIILSYQRITVSARLLPIRSGSLEGQNASFKGILLQVHPVPNNNTII